MIEAYKEVAMLREFMLEWKKALNEKQNLDENTTKPTYSHGLNDALNVMLGMVNETLSMMEQRGAIEIKSLD